MYEFNESNRYIKSSSHVLAQSNVEFIRVWKSTIYSPQVHSDPTTLLGIPLNHSTLNT